MPAFEDRLLTRISVDGLLDRLDPRERLIVRWRYWWGMEEPHIGRKLNIEQWRVRLIRFRAERKLAAWMSQDDQLTGEATWQANAARI